MSTTATHQPRSQQDNPPLQTPFANIALAMSGGGFRAASFSLGTLGYLYAVEFTPGQTLLGNVSFISSASGGTITNASYALSVFAGQPFQAYYHRLRNLLQGEALLKEALEILNNDNEWPTGEGNKGRTLINAFAKVYDRKLFNGATLGQIWHGEDKPVLATCFNATEFYKGMSFRFQTPANDRDGGFWGNKYLKIDRDNKDKNIATQNEAIYKKIKLGDVLAASSCFPAGFEPILYPRDFAYTSPNGTLMEKELKDAMTVGEYDESQRPLDKAVALMDGGITDNQGLYSAMEADNRLRSRQEGRGYDLIMSTDVASYFLDAYNAPVEKPASGWRGKNISFYIGKIRGALDAVKWLAIGAGIVLVLGVLLALMLSMPALVAMGWIIAGVAVTILVMSLWALHKANNNKAIQALTSETANDDIGSLLDSIGASSSFSPSIIHKLSYYLSNTRLNALELMAKARITSVITMVMDINLKQVRRLIYELLYSNQKWEDRRKQNAIYDLSSFNKRFRRFRINKKQPILTEAEKNLLLNDCEAMEKIAEDARNMGTTLWFDDKDDKGDMLKKIISCGHFTTCANLLEYVMVLQHRPLSFAPEVTTQLQNIRVQLESHWQQFKANPYFLYEQLG